MKTATYIALVLTLILFGIGAYYYFIVPNAVSHERFMGLATVSIVILVMPCFLLWRYFKRVRSKKESSNK